MDIIKGTPAMVDNYFSNNGELWSEFYQTDNTSSNLVKWAYKVGLYKGNAVEEDRIVELSNKAVTEAFSGDLISFSDEELIELVRNTAYIESNGGKYIYQIGGGPGRGWWQVEQETARDLLGQTLDTDTNQITSDGSITPILGKNGAKYLEEIGLDYKQLQAMSFEDFNETLTIPEVSAFFATAKYVRAMYKKFR